MTEVSDGARTLQEAVRQYHADALSRARTGWIPLTEDRRTDPPLVVVEYAHLPSAAEEVVSVLEALVPQATKPHRLFRMGRRPGPSDRRNAR